jgi:phosphatidylserine/phosphatidylglycerophosphate/cardiolipin synthase-like enzyme
MITKSKTRHILIGLSLSAVLFAGCGEIKNGSAVPDVIDPIGFPQKTVVALSNSVSPGSGSDANIEYGFTQEDQHPEKMLIKVINDTTKTLDIAIYSLTKKSIVDAILTAKKRGVQVRIITDKTQSTGKSQAEQIKKLRNASIPMRVNHHSGLMHLKLTLADRSILTTGSFNYSAAASNINDEVFLVINDQKMAVEWTKVFEEMWQDKKRFDIIK